MRAIPIPSGSGFMANNEDILWKEVKYMVALAHKSLFPSILLCCLSAPPSTKELGSAPDPPAN